MSGVLPDIVKIPVNGYPGLKVFKMQESILSKYFVILSIFISLNSISGQTERSESPGEEDSGFPTGIELNTEKSTFLYCSKATSVTGDLAL